MSGGPSPLALLVDSNVLFIRRITAALKNEGFEVVQHAAGSYALTMLEWNTPDVILCATEFREMGAFEMAAILRADSKTARIPIVALGSGLEPGQFQAYRAGCDDYIDRRRSPAEIASHLRTFLASSRRGFQPTQMLSSADASISGSLAHLDLTGVVQMLAQASQTGALHINASETDAIIFFERGEMKHAECGKLTGDQAVLRIIHDCHLAQTGVYKFVADSTTSELTVHRRATDLLLDALRECDEAGRESAERDLP